jgi:hypothetical protein
MRYRWLLLILMSTVELSTMTRPSFGAETPSPLDDLSEGWRVCQWHHENINGGYRDPDYDFKWLPGFEICETIRQRVLARKQAAEEKMQALIKSEYERQAREAPLVLKRAVEQPN